MIPAPPALQSPAPAPLRPAPMAGLLGIPYLDDAVQDAQGRWTTFTHPERPLPGPGLNCSGFVVAVARRLLGFAGSPGAAARDRRGDSGPGAERGPDWDFGWDLVLNLSEGRARRWLFPDGARPVGEAEAATIRGVPIHDAQAFPAMLAGLRPGAVGLLCFIRNPGGRRVFHHVAVLLPEPGGRIGFYQTLPRGRSHRLELASPAGMARLREMFGPGERVLLLAVETPAD